MKKPKLKIVQVIASKGWGGREMVPLLLSGEFKERGHAAVLWTDPRTPLGRRTAELGFDRSPLGHRSHLDPRVYLEARRALEKDAPDILHVHYSRDLWALVPILKAAGWKGPLVLTKHIESSVSKKDPFHKFLYDRVDLLLGCSTMVRDNVVRTCPVDPARVLVGHPPVDTGKFHPKVREGKALRKKWGVQGPVIGMVARLSSGKGHGLLLKVAALLARKYPRLTFKMAGAAAPEEIEYVHKLERLRDDLGLKGRFDFEGYVEDVPTFLSALDLAVHAAPHESFGLAIVEAMACGKPVLARKGGGVEDIFRGKAPGGKMIDSEDPGPWARTIEGLLKAPSTLRALAKGSRGNADRFSLKAVADRHLAWYGELLERRRVR